MTIYTVPQILDTHVAQKTRPTVEREPPETETFGDDADEERRSLPSQKIQDVGTIKRFRSNRWRICEQKGMRGGGAEGRELKTQPWTIVS